PDTVNLLFRVDWGGYPGLAQRLVRLEAFGPDGSLTVLPDAGHFGNGHHLIPVAMPQHLTVRYVMVLTPPQNSELYHRASQLDSQGGHLLAGDLLPRVWVGPPRDGERTAHVWIGGLPNDWRIATVLQRSGTGYSVDDILEAVFVVGRLRTKRLNLGPRALTVAMHGGWPVPDERVMDAVERIAGTLHRIAADGWRSGDHLFAAGRVPRSVPGQSTGGQVIGRSGIIYLAGAGPGDAMFQQWLRTTAHELMHWYIPTGFDLDPTSFNGAMPAWFSEGFTDYMALKILLVSGLLRPHDFLAEIGERLARYQSSPLYGSTSVTEAQTDFWRNDAYRFIYDGGAAAAFLLDLGFQDRGGSLERALGAIRRAAPVTRDVLFRSLASIRENEWVVDWVSRGAEPDWDARLARYRLSWQHDTLVSSDDWVTDALSSIRP
ncbi:MAG: hypothetical protein JSU87_12250, partial [Gemmatimonadota bacterium]